MNKKSLLIVLIIIVLVITAAICWRLLYSNQNQIIPLQKTDNSIDLPVSTLTPAPTDFTAVFEIFTNGTKRIFTAAKYHNKSLDVFIQSPDPSIIYVKKEGITWADFFNTLPFSLSKTCLVTGTKQTFCSTNDKKLRFFLNGIEMPDALDLMIKPGDTLRAIYGE